MTRWLDKTVEELRASLPALLSIGEAAEVSRRSATTIRRAIKGGVLPFNQPAGAGGDIRLPRDAVLDWAFALRVHEAPDAPEARRPENTRRHDRHHDARGNRKRRPPLRVVARGAPSWTEEEMRRFATSYTATGGRPDARGVGSSVIPSAADT